MASTTSMMWKYLSKTSPLKSPMPPRWPRQPDRNDPAFRKIDDRMNFAFHVALFSASNSGLWFFHNFLHTNWQWLPYVTCSWFAVLLVHLIYISAIANYSDNPPKST